MKNFFLEEHRRYLPVIIIASFLLWWWAWFASHKFINIPFYLGFMFRALSASSLLIIVFPTKTYTVWKWFSVVYLPLAFGWVIFFAPRICSDICFTSKDALSDFFGIFYFAISIFIALGVTVVEYIKKKQKT